MKQPQNGRMDLLMHTPSREKHFLSLVCGVALVLLTACAALPDKPVRSLMYDFGPGLVSVPAATQTQLPAIALEELSTVGGAIDNQSVLYRLAYTDRQQLRPYSQARWSMPPAQLVQQRLRETLSQRRPVFSAGEGVALNRSQSEVLPRVLKLQLQEFSQLFSTPDASVGLIRLQATLVEITPVGEKLLFQRLLVVQRPAPTPDAAGGVSALALATDAAITEIDRWLQTASPKP
jgi:cholesterol transport system auxiliary component